MPSVNTVLCSACHTLVPCTQQELYPDDGWVLPFDTFGYYGGFDDNLPVLVGNRQSRQWIMCHDCVVKFLTMFPLLGETVGPSCHVVPREEGKEPCCRHAWRGTEMFGRFEHGVHTQSSWPDGVWHDDPAEANG